MGKIYGEKQETVIRKIKRKVVGIECDCCGKVISTDAEYLHELKYFRVITGHHDWGNDSIESIKEYLICPECIGKFTSDYLNDPKGYDSAYIDVNTEYMEYDEYDYCVN